MTIRSRLPIATTLLLAWSTLAGAAEPAAVASQAEKIPEPRAFVTEHKGTFNGKSVSYRAVAGETYLRDNDGEPTASIFSFAYIATGKAAAAPRPVTFLWNGGPGSASVWLHMGTFGPVRVDVPDDGVNAGPPPYSIKATPETLLDVTDLVFVDPVGTGFSRALGTHENKEFWGLAEDAKSMAEFIRTWTTENGRWNSPRFLLGESFGTTRAALVADLLEGNGFMMGLNGLIFISQAMDYTGSTPYMRDNIIASVTYLPTMAATALYHGKVSATRDQQAQFLQEARQFATDELLPALFKGNTLDTATRSQVAEKLARFTGLSPEYIELANLQVQGFRFAKELLRDQGLAVGLLDGRYTLDEIDDLTDSPSRDAADAGISNAFKSALMTYMREQLAVDWERRYLAPADEELGKQWRWRPVADGEYWEPSYVNTSHALSRAMRVNPKLRVLVASGYYDLVTPFFDAEFTLQRHDIPADRVDFHYYEGGHMMYVQEASRTQLLKDARAFIEAQLSATE